MQVTTKNRFLLNFQIGELCKELIDLGLEKDKKYTDSRAYSAYTPDQDQTWVTPWIGLANAIWTDLGFAKNPDGSDVACGRGQTAEGDFVSESPSMSRPEVRIVTRYNPKKGSVKGYAYDASLGKSLRVVIDPGYAKKNTAQNFHTKSAHILYAILDKVYANDEAMGCRADIQSAMASGDKEEAMFALLRLTDNAYRRIITLSERDEAYLPLDDVGNGTQIPKLARESILTSKIKRSQGTLTEAGQQKPNAGVQIDYEKYNLHIEYPDDIPVVRKQKLGWRSTPVGKDILDEFSMSLSDPFGKVLNHLIEGPNGTGKTALVWNDVAYGLGVPVLRQLLSGDMSKEEGVSSFYPEADDQASPAVRDFLASMPDVLEAQLNPAAAYKKIMGKDNPKATVDQVLALINEKLKEFIATHKESSNGIRLVYVKGPTLEANEYAEKYGAAILCLDEITRAPQEIITMYNGFLELDGNGGIQTPNGWVKRSPNLIVIGCANPPSTNQYVKVMDESLRNRFQSFHEQLLPDTETMAETLMGYGHITDPILAETMADVIETAYDAMKANGITGAISLRQLGEWGRTISYGWDMEKALQVKVLGAITSEKEDQQTILQAIEDNTNIKSWYK